MDINHAFTGDSASVDRQQGKGPLAQDDFDNDSALNGLVAREGLDAGDTAQVQALVDEVRRADRVGLKLNWEPRNPCAPTR